MVELFVVYSNRFAAVVDSKCATNLLVSHSDCGKRKGSFCLAEVGIYNLDLFCYFVALDVLDQTFNSQVGKMRYLLIAACLLILFVSYHFKSANFSAAFTDSAWQYDLNGRLVESPWAFVVNKVFRFLLNDLLTIALIQALFMRRNYTYFAFGVMLFSLLVLLPTFFLGNALSWPESITAMLHRLTMNPVLLMLLIPAFYFQSKKSEATV